MRNRAGACALPAWITDAYDSHTSFEAIFNRGCEVDEMYFHDRSAYQSANQGFVFAATTSFQTGQTT
jgi:hypothetical protein